MAVGEDALYCSKCGNRQAVAKAPMPVRLVVPAATPGPRGYVWGYIQGSLLILAGFIFIARFHSVLARVNCVLAILVGICILRRNRLTVPAFFLYFSFNLLLFGFDAWVDPSKTYNLVKVIILGTIYLTYYLNRKDEFDAWV